jgi:hypothetical protein
VTALELAASLGFDGSVPYTCADPLNTFIRRTGSSLGSGKSSVSDKRLALAIPVGPSPISDQHGRWNVKGQIVS